MFFSSDKHYLLLSMQRIFISFITERNESKKGAKTLLRPFGSKRQSRALARRPEHKFFKSLKELASLKQLFVFRFSDCSNAIRDSMLIQRICIPLKTSSCGMFSNERSERGNMEYEVRKRLVAWLVQEIL